MSFDRTNPNHCPTCDTTEPCVHRATRSAHVAYREGRDDFNIPWSNRVPIEQINMVCPYPRDSDEASWWHRGFQSEVRHALVAEAREARRRVGSLLGEQSVHAGTYYVEALVEGTWWQYAILDKVVADRVWMATTTPGWSAWMSHSLAASEVVARGRLVPVSIADQPPMTRGNL